MGLSTIALGGLERAFAQFQGAATRIAAPASASANAGTVDLSAAAISMLAARNEFAGNIQVLKMAVEMQRLELDVLA